MTVKESVIHILTDNIGKVISGEQMAETIGVSRTAIWKAINSLETQGFKIDKKQSGGYCLSIEDNKLWKEGILSHINENINIDLTMLEEVDSTNQYLKSVAVDTGTEGMVVIAAHQTNGKGRLGRSFASPKNKGIYMSILLKPTPSTPVHMLTIIAAISVCDALESLTSLKAEIKWVNDIFYNGKKICGILTEAGITAESGMVDWAIVGIGINISSYDTDFPKEVSQVATSILELGEKVDRNKLTAAVINRFFDYYYNTDIKKSLALYKSRQLILGKNITVIGSRESYPAKAIDLDESGHLIVLKEDGQMITLVSGEVSIRGF